MQLDAKQLFEKQEELNIVKKFNFGEGEIIVKYPSNVLKEGQEKTDYQLLCELIEDFRERTEVEEGVYEISNNVPTTILLKDVFKLTTNLDLSTLDELQLQQWINHTPPWLMPVLNKVKEVFIEIQNTMLDEERIEIDNAISQLNSLANIMNTADLTEKQIETMSVDKWESVLDKYDKMLGGQNVEPLQKAREELNKIKTKQLTPKQQEVERLKQEQREKRTKEKAELRAKLAALDEEDNVVMVDFEEGE